MSMCSPIFRWKLVPSPPPRTDSQETYFEGAEKVNFEEPNTQQEHESVSQVSLSVHEPPCHSRLSPNSSAREDFSKSLDSTPSNFDFGTPADLAVKSKSANNPSDFELVSQDLESQGDMSVDSEDFVPSSQPLCLNPSDRTFFEGAEKRHVDDCTPLDCADSEVSTGISNSYCEDNGTQATTNHSAQTSQREQSSNHESNAMLVNERNLESLPETGLDVDLQQDLVELMDNFPVERVFSMADFDDFLRVLSSPPHANGNDLSDPSSVAGLESALDHLRLSSASESSSNPTASSSEESNQGSKLLKRILSSPINEEAKKRRMSGIKTPRPMGKPAKCKKPSQLTPCHTMTLRSKEIRMRETPKRLGLVAEESPSQKRVGKSGNKMQVLLEQEKRKTRRRRGTEGKAPSSTWSGKARAGKKMLEESQNSFVEEDINFKTRARLGRPKKTPGSYSEPFLEDYREVDNKSRKSTKKNPKRGNSQPIGLIRSGASSKAFTPGPAQVPVTRKDPTAAQVNQVGAYLLSARTKLVDAVFEETTLPKEHCQNIRREIKERAGLLLQWSQSGIEDGKIRYQVEDLTVLCESLQRQLDSLIDNASLITPGLEPHFSDSQNDHFLVPGTPPSQRLRLLEEKTRAEVRVVAKKNNIKMTDQFGRKRSQRDQASQSKNSGDNPQVSPRALNRGSRPPPVIINSSPLREATLTVPKNSSPFIEELRLAGRKALPTCTHACGCAPKSLKTSVDRGTNTDFIEPPKPKLIEMSTQTDVREFKKRKVLVDSGTNTDIFYSVNWDESSDDDRRVPDCDDKENVDPSLDLIKNITGAFLPREGDCTPRPYDCVLQEIMANPNFALPQSYLDDMRWGSSDSD